MLTKKQMQEIREHLDNAQNPVFFFDNDPDGLCSFLLLQRYCGKGKGVLVNSFPNMTVDYFRKVREFNADYIFILDKPRVSKEFFEEARQVNIPVVWIDHHEIDKKTIPEFVNYYNPLLNRFKSNEPVTYLCQRITERKEDLWLAVAGSISDKFVPSFYSKFLKEYPDLGIKSKDAFGILYRSQIGKIALMFSFALKDRTTNVVNMFRFLMKVKTPYEVLEECSKNKTMHDRYNYINNRYVHLIAKAKANVNEGRFLFFKYSGELSMSSDLANELSYIFPKKVIVVMFVSGLKVNVSVRGKKIRETILNAINQLEDATGGGHEDAVGARIKIEDIEKFKELLEKD